ncbi:MAG: conjugative transfer signal peptidase TraF [Acetobacter sp.]|nr:conjugative transfer signal peptidase TraF [Acetobacter sp.]
MITYLSRQPFLLSLWIFIVLTLSTLAFVQQAGLRINTSPSIPIGIYRITSEPIKVGNYVLLCPENKEPFITAQKRGYIGTGYCPGGLGYMFKRVAALPNDIITTTANGMQINGKLYPDSKPFKHDALNRVLPVWHATQTRLKAGEVVLMTQGDKNSFDARYFGPLPQQQIISVVQPVLIWQ